MTKATPRQILAFIRDLIRQYLADQGVLNAAALTYTTLFAVVPLMTVLYTMLAAIPSFRGVGETIQTWIFSNFVPSTGEVVQQYLQGFTSQARSLTGVGIAFLLITSILMIRNIEVAMNRIWRVREPRKGLFSFLLYWAVLTLGPMLIGLGLGLSSYVASLNFLPSASESWKSSLLALLPPLLSTAAFTLLYTAVPNCRVPVRNAFIGGVAAAVAFEVAKRGFALFVTSSPSYQLIYGAFAAVPLFLLWIYISWSIVLFGAELTRKLTLLADREYASEPSILGLLSILYELWKGQQKGEALRESRLLQRAGVARANWDRLLDCLRQADLVQRTDHGRLVLSRDLSRFTLVELLDRVPEPIPAEIAENGRKLPPWKHILQQRLERLSVERQALLDLSLANLFIGDIESEPQSSGQSANH